MTICVEAPSPTTPVGSTRSLKNNDNKTRRVQEQAIEVEYKKTGISPSDVALLRRWLETQPHLPHNYITDLDLVLCYHSCYMSTEVAKQVLDKHFTLKTLFTNIFKDRVVDDSLLKTLQVVAMITLETPSHDNYNVIYHRLIDTDLKNFNFIQIIRMALMLLDLRQYEHGTWPGLILVIDLAGVSLGHLAKLDLLTVQQILYFLQEGMLVRLKGIHFTNAPTYVDRLLLILRPFLKPELMSILKVHSLGSNTLEQYIPLRALPRDVGGEYITFQQSIDEATARLCANADFFVQENKKRVKESLRPGKPKTISDVFNGVEGSFKKLSID